LSRCRLTITSLTLAAQAEAGGTYTETFQAFAGMTLVDTVSATANNDLVSVGSRP